MKNWAFLRSNNVPKHLGEVKPPIYQHILTAVDRIGVDLDLLSDHSVKDLLLKALTPLPSGCLALSSGNVGLIAFSIGLTFGNTCMVVSVRTGKATAWRIAHGVVKTQAYLKSWLRLGVGDSHAGCGEKETISHAFFACWLVSPVWSWVLTLINKLYTTPMLLTNPLILLHCGLPRCKQFQFSNELCSFPIKLTLNELWAAQNLGTFESKQPTFQNIISKIKACIRHRIRVAFNFSPRPDFIKSSAHHDALCSYTHQQLIIHI